MRSIWLTLSWQILLQSPTHLNSQPLNTLHNTEAPSGEVGYQRLLLNFCSLISTSTNNISTCLHCSTHIRGTGIERGQNVPDLQPRARLASSGPWSHSGCCRLCKQFPGTFIVWGCLGAASAEVTSCKDILGAQNPKYLLSGPFQKNADLCLVGQPFGELHVGSILLTANSEGPQGIIVEIQATRSYSEEKSCVAVVTSFPMGSCHCPSRKWTLAQKNEHGEGEAALRAVAGPRGEGDSRLSMRLQEGLGVASPVCAQTGAYFTFVAPLGFLMTSEQCEPQRTSSLLCSPQAQTRGRNREPPKVPLTCQPRKNGKS